MATVLLEMALSEQVAALEPTTLPGLPAALASPDLDPFAVPKGNAIFGPVPIEANPTTLEEAGGESFSFGAGPAVGLERGNLSGHVDAMRSYRQGRSGDTSAEEGSMENEEETMDIED
jgi:hypothetical protein